MGKGKNRGTAKAMVAIKPQLSQEAIRNRIASHFTNLVKVFKPTKVDAITAIAWFAADVICKASLGPTDARMEDVVMTIRGMAAEFRAAFDSILQNNIQYLTKKETNDGNGTGNEQ